MDLLKDNVELDDFQGTIDYLDIIEINKMQLVNETAILSQNSFIKEAYKYDWFL